MITEWRHEPESNGNKVTVRIDKIWKDSTQKEMFDILCAIEDAHREIVTELHLILFDEIPIKIMSCTFSDHMEFRDKVIKQFITSIH